MSAIGRLATVDHGAYRAHRGAALGEHHVRRIHQIRVDIGCRHGHWRAFDIGVIKYHFARQRVGTKADDHAMHRRHAFGVVAPLKSAMRKLNLYALRQHPSPQHAYLFALGDAIGGHKSAARTHANGEVALGCVWGGRWARFLSRRLMSARRLPRARPSVGEVARRLHIPASHKV